MNRQSHVLGIPQSPRLMALRQKLQDNPCVHVHLPIPFTFNSYSSQASRSIGDRRTSDPTRTLHETTHGIASMECRSWRTAYNVMRIKSKTPCPVRQQMPCSCCLDGVLPQGEVDVLLPLFQGLLLLFELVDVVRLSTQTSRMKSNTYGCQSPSDRPRLLGAEVKGLVLLGLVELPEVLSLLLVHNSHDPSNRLADGVAAMLGHVIPSVYSSTTTHILVNFAAEPPAIFWTRSVRSSFLSSASCFDKSFFDLRRAFLSMVCQKIEIQDVLRLELIRLDLAGHFGEIY